MYVFGGLFIFYFFENVAQQADNEWMVRWIDLRGLADSGDVSDCSLIQLCLLEAWSETVNQRMLCQLGKQFFWVFTLCLNIF